MKKRLSSIALTLPGAMRFVLQAHPKLTIMVATAHRWHPVGVMPAPGGICRVYAFAWRKQS
ncbi:MAG: hypothetical protein GYB65_14955 [Chloroflexi bacterium]|nr:hypothetical protein [Chloroflexota bacterium]